MSTENLEALMGQFIEQLTEKLGETNTLLTEIHDELSQIREELSWVDKSSAVGHLAGKLGEIKSAVKQVGEETENIYTCMLTK